MKKLYLHGGKVTRVSDQGLTPRRSPFVKGGFQYEFYRLEVFEFKTELI